MRHIQALRALEHRVIAVPVRAERAQELRGLDIETAASMQEAVDLGATAAIIATDTGRHVRDATDALALGCHVLVEKPLAPSAVEIGALVVQSLQAKRRVFVAYCLRFHDGLALFRTRLPEIGEVHAVRIACQSFLPSWRPDRDYRVSYSARVEEGGVLRDLSHEIDYALWLFGPPQEGVFALLPSTSRLGIAAEESADLLWRNAAGAVVSVRLDYLTECAGRSMLAQGDRGQLEWDALAGTVRLSGGQGHVVSVPQDRDAMMRSQAAAFIRGCDGDVDPRLCTIEEGRLVLATCDAARRSSTAGQSVSLGDETA
jgi:predicted dehydrogenase